jgi:pyruvate dehydrogenase E1 component
VRQVKALRLEAPPLEYFQEMLNGSGGREVSTTMAFVRLLTLLLRHPRIGRYVVPIVPDEARTFGMDALFRQIGMYASQGQLYKPVDQEMLLYYKESTDGQILQEGITEAGAMGSFTAAGTAYANYGVPMIPLYIYYSMFGYQRVGDQVWAFADARGRGFLIGATAGRTTLAGEGLQHQDGHSHLLMSAVPTCASYDPAFAYETAVILQDGLRRMYQEGEDRFYYLTVSNENYAQPPMPEGCAASILHGIYLYRAPAAGRAVVQLFGSGSILREALRAQELLDRYGVAAAVWSVTSYNQLRRQALGVERWNRLHPAQPARRPYLLEALEGAVGPIIAATDYMKAVPDQVAPWMAGRLVALGTDGFGRSDNREQLRKHFEVSAEAIAASALASLARKGGFDPATAQKAQTDLALDPKAIDPAAA